MTALSFVFAIVAALLFALSASLQQSAARSTALAAPRRSPLIAPFVLIGKLLRQPVWLTGLGANIVGFVAHAGALRLGPIPVVQALLVTQLLFALPLAAARRRLRPLRRDWTGTALVCAGLVVLVVQHVPHGEVQRPALPYGLAAVLGSVALIVSVTIRIPLRRTQTRAALLGIAAGCCSCATAVLVVAATADLPRLSWPLFAIAGSTVFSGVLAQAAFASGSLPTALTAMTVTDPTLSYVAAGTLFVTVSSPALLPAVCAAALVVTGVALLANSPTLHDELDHRPPDDDGQPTASFDVLATDFRGTPP